MSADYRRIRFLAFLHPWEDPQNTGYQLIQSLIALGSGGLTGVGLGASRQKWEYVPNAHTDFIFSILGEELGLIGELVVLLAFGVLIYAGIRIATTARDVFARLLAAGIVSWFGLQALINLGAVTGLLPVTGVPLPFLSYGGSSLVVSLDRRGRARRDRAIVRPVLRPVLQVVAAGSSRLADRRHTVADRRHAVATRPAAVSNGTGAMRILVAGGGTAGHVFPALALAHRLVVDGTRGPLRRHGERPGGAARPRGRVAVRRDQGPTARTQGLGRAP